MEDGLNADCVNLESCFLCLKRVWLKESSMVALNSRLFEWRQVCHVRMVEDV